MLGLGILTGLGVASIAGFAWLKDAAEDWVDDYLAGRD